MVRRAATPEPPTAPTPPPTMRLGPLSTMTAAELTEEYNRLTGENRSRFRSRPAALRAVLEATPLPEPEPPTPAAQGVHARMADQVIQVLTDVNPYRAGSTANTNFEKLRPTAISVRTYLSLFPEGERRTARQWLWNMKRDGHIRTVER